jgi:integrase
LGGVDLMASIRRKGRSWQTIFAVYIEGRRIQRTRNFASQALAKRYAAQMELQEQRGVGSARITLGDYLAGWLAAKAATIEPNTLAGYTRWAGHIERCHVATLPVDRIAPLDLERTYQHLLSVPAGRGKPLSPQSVRHCHALLQNVLGDAVRHKLIETNPAAAAKPPKGQAVKVAVPSPEQVGALLDDIAQHNLDLLDLAILFVGTGLRRSEALGLRWKDLDWVARRIVVRQVVIEHDGAWSIRAGTKSQAGQRTISVAPVVIEALRQQQARVADLRLKIGRHWHEHDLIFPSVEGGPRAPASVTKAFTRSAQRVGWPANSSPVHSLRHAAASHALAAGVTLATIARRLGHSSPAVTARIYLSADAEQDRAAGETMAVIAGRR